VILFPGARHWHIFSDLCKSGGARGNLIPDAYFAAIAIESGSEWITMDGDYARFAGLRCRPFG
jgi:predicted nucleic acid-binding protein